MTEKGLSSLERGGNTSPMGVKWRREEGALQGMPEVNAFVLSVTPLKMAQQDHHLKGIFHITKPNEYCVLTNSTAQELTTELIIPSCLKPVILLALPVLLHHWLLRGLPLDPLTLLFLRA